MAPAPIAMGTVAVMSIDTEPAVASVERPPADRFMRALLRVDRVEHATAADARKAMQTSVLVSAVRCLLTYIVLPFVLPFLGLAAGVGPAIGAVIGIIAAVCIVSSMRRFWRVDHRARWGYTAFGTAMMLFLVAMSIRDIIRVF
jgi:hypothetical protein